MGKDQFATSEVNVTYYLGAGASAQALPIVNKIKIDDVTEIRGMADCFKDLSEELKSVKGIEDENIPMISQLISSLDELSKKSIEFGTIDTYAKYLFLCDRSKLTDLKISVIFFFLSEQIIKKKLDKRILIFLTTILQHQQVFPTNIKILSWNYDFQIETTAESFKKESFEHRGTSISHSPALLSYYPSLGFSFRDTELDLFHLNGIAGYYRNENISDHLFINKEITDYNTLLKYLKKNIQSLSDYLSFAWERYQNNNLFSLITPILQKTNVLVIIGYSFPFFNRETDKQIFDVLKSNSEFHKIYYQDPFLDGQFLKNQFALGENIEIKHIKETKNYYVPMEL